MEDLSALQTALRDSAAAQARTDDELDSISFLALAETYLKSSDPAVRQIVATTLGEILDDAAEEQKSAILADAALTLLPVLIPLVSDFEQDTDLTRLVEMVVAHASPKEVVLALQEVLSGIEDRAELPELSEDGYEEEPAGPDFVGLASQLQLVLGSYTSAIPNIRVSRSTPTLLSVCDALNSALPAIAPNASTPRSRQLLVGLSSLVTTAWTWVQGTTDVGGEQRAMLTQLLAAGVTLLATGIDAHVAERWFKTTFPKYASPYDGAQAETWRLGQEALDAALRAFQTIDVGLDDLAAFAMRPNSTSPHQSLAAINLLAASLLSSPDANTNSVFDLEDFIPILSAALGSTALDAGVAWTWHLVHSGAKVSFENACMLVELLVPLAGMPLDPTSGLVVFKLVAALISAVSSPEERIRQYKQLLEPENPFEQIRVQSLSLVREAITTDKALLIPSFLTELGATVFAIPSQSEARLTIAGPYPHAPATPPLALPLSELVGSMWPAWFTECLNLLRLLIISDEENKTGVRSKNWLAKTEGHWVEPQAEKLEDLAPEVSAADLSVHFVLDRWKDALERLRDTTRNIRS